MHVVVSRPFRNNAANRNSEGAVVQTLFLCNVLKMQWACVPSPSASVRCVALFYVQNVFYAAGSWKSDHRNAGKLKFFVLEQNTSAGARDSNNVAIEKATVDFPATVSVHLFTLMPHSHHVNPTTRFHISEFTYQLISPPRPS